MTVPDVTARAGSLRDEVIEAGLLIPSAATGIYGRNAVFEGIVASVDDLITSAATTDGAEVVRFPPVFPRGDLETTGYLSSFPHLAGSVFGFEGDESDAVELGDAALRHEDWSGTQTMTDVCLVPAACYPVYPWVARSGRLPKGGRLIDVCGFCFRHEPSVEPMRMQAFRQREHVRLGSAADVAAWHARWVDLSGRLLASIGLLTQAVPASDPFFGRAGRMLAASQEEQGLKIERLITLRDGGHPTAITSVNYHQDHFGRDFGIETEDGEVAHTACFGFGLERVALALFAVHGVDPVTWPSDVRRALFLDG